VRWSLFALLLASVACPAKASIPVGSQFGRWHVSSISSLSGSDADPAARMTQERNKNQYGVSDELEISWGYGSSDSISFSISIQNCTGKDKDFFRSNVWKIADWLDAGEITAAEKIKSEMRKWISEAASTCKSRNAAHIFTMARFDKAMTAYIDYLRQYSPQIAATV
jgi:hypothetical protein